MASLPRWQQEFLGSEQRGVGWEAPGLQHWGISPQGGAGTPAPPVAPGSDLLLARLGEESSPWEGEEAAEGGLLIPHWPWQPAAWRIPSLPTCV